jgi:HD-like signal output (HDOD) protein
MNHRSARLNKFSLEFDSVVADTATRSHAVSNTQTKVPVKPVVSLAKIPAFPSVVLRVLEVVSDDEPDLIRLVSEINSDATLSAQVLRLANSPLFAFTGQISSVQHAVAALGIEQIQSLVMSVATANYSKAAFRSESLRKCWRHTVASAVVCREIARAAGMPPEESYSLGLLHDIGRLGLLAAWPDDYSRILEEATNTGNSLLELERNLFDMDHCEVGHQLATQWKLPPQFIAVAGHHHDSPPESEDLNHLSITHIGCRMADALGYWAAKPAAHVEPGDLYTLLPATVREHFPADPEELRLLIERAVNDDRPALGRPAQEFTRPQDASPNTRPQAAPIQLVVQQRNSLAWDLTLVAGSIVMFLLVLAGLLYFRHSG